MCTRSIVMQPARANPSDWTGDGPAIPALSRVTEALSLVPASVSPPIHVRSTTVGGFVTLQIVPPWGLAATSGVSWSDGFSRTHEGYEEHEQPFRPHTVSFGSYLRDEPWASAPGRTTSARCRQAAGARYAASADAA